MVAKFEIFVSHTEVEKPLMAEILPVGEPFEVRSGFAEEFKFHLFKLTDAENEVAGSDFVAETFADLSDSERNLFASGALNVFEVYEYTLCSFGAEIHG